YHALVKDGLGFSGNSFLKFLDPSMMKFKDVSNSLNVLLTELNTGNKTGNYWKALQKYYGDIHESDTRKRVADIYSKMLTYAQNDMFQVKSREFNPNKAISGIELSKDDSADLMSYLAEVFPRSIGS